MATVISFYLANGPYGEFSNYSRFRIWLGNKSWPTAEHYFQAMKFHSVDAEKGRDRKRQLRADWGDGGDGSGKNRLGEILMEVREKLRSSEGPSGTASG